MRKYFLLSAVALLAATNVNATYQAQDELVVNAEVAYAVDLNCSALDFGKIIMKVNPTQDSTVTIFDGVDGFTGDILDVQGGNQATCDSDKMNSTIGTAEDTSVVLSHESTADKLSATITQTYDNWFGGTLTIPAGSPSGKYTGTTTVTVTFE
ncbi:MAG: DUF4402 domain-containing protein [Alphaproteobacteria bacterium]|nr:DUF4402 domain-containing protein [Alphaproteobacteria bacterium]